MYKFGSRIYTLEEIKDIAFRHGTDGIQFYPPARWAEQPCHPADKVYEEAYRAGVEYRKQCGMSPM